MEWEMRNPFFELLFQFKCVFYLSSFSFLILIEKLKRKFLSEFSFSSLMDGSWRETDLKLAIPLWRNLVCKCKCVIIHNCVMCNNLYNEKDWMFKVRVRSYDFLDRTKVIKQKTLTLQSPINWENSPILLM